MQLPLRRFSMSALNHSDLKCFREAGLGNVATAFTILCFCLSSSVCFAIAPHCRLSTRNISSKTFLNYGINITCSFKVEAVLLHAIAPGHDFDSKQMQ